MCCHAGVYESVPACWYVVVVHGETLGGYTGVVLYCLVATCIKQ